MRECAVHRTAIDVQAAVPERQEQRIGTGAGLGIEIVEIGFDHVLAERAARAVELLPALVLLVEQPVGRAVAALSIAGAAEFQTTGALRLVEAHSAAITAVRRADGTAEDALQEKRKVMEALGALEAVWDEHYPPEQARILRLLIERIDVAPDGISVTLHAAGLRSLVAELAREDTAPEPVPGAILEAAE